MSAAWNPSFKNGLLGKLIGERKTVLRGGYSLIYDRTNTVQTIIIPTLGVGFAQTINIIAPKNAAGQPYRIGVDGAIPLPSAPSQLTSPVIPGKTPYGETLSFSVDPFIKVPRQSARLTAPAVGVSTGCFLFSIFPYEPRNQARQHLRL